MYSSKCISIGANNTLDSCLLPLELLRIAWIAENRFRTGDPHTPA
jgi:hypothetical protein